MSVTDLGKVNVENQEDLEKLFHDNSVNVVFFYGITCGPCNNIKNFINQYVRTISNVVFLQIDARSTPGLIEKYNIEGVPRFLFFVKKNGKIIVGDEGFAGANQNTLINKIQNSLNKLYKN